MKKNTKNILFIELEDKTSAIHLLPLLRRLHKGKLARIVLLGEQGTYLAKEAKKLRIPLYTIKHMEFNIHEPKTYIPFLRAVRLIGRIIRTHDIRIIHCHRLNWAYLGIIASMLWRTKLFVDIVYLEKLTSMIQKLLLKLHRQTLFLAVSEFAKSKFLSFYPFIPSARVRVFCGGIDIPPNPTGRPNSHPIPQWRGKKTVAMVSRLTPEKGVDIFIEAAGILAQSHKNARFVFIGRQPNRIWKKGYYEECLTRIHNLGLDRVFTMKDFTYDMDPYYRVIYCSVLPTLRDALGYVLLESLSYGKPVVTNDVDGAPETVNHGKAGLLIPAPPSSVLLAKNIDLLLKNKKTYDMYARAGLDWVRTRFNSRIQTKLLLRIYENV